MRAKVIVRRADKIVQLVDTSIDEVSVDSLVTRLKQHYGDSYTIDQEQVELARAAAGAGQD